jgi:2,5-dihydroxypyridine 5,6-dioxygenase
MLRFPLTPNVAADLVSLFREGLRASRVGAGETVVVYCDTLANPHYPAAFLAAAKDLGADAFQVVQPAIPADPTRGGGGRAAPTPVIVETMKRADVVVDVSTGGMLYSDAQDAILGAGTRILRVREPDDTLRRMFPSEEVRRRSLAGQRVLAAARRLRVVTEDGTDLRVEKGDRRVHVQYGMADEPGRWDHWPTGMVSCTLLEESLEGRLVIGRGSLLFPLERYVMDPVACRIEGGRVAAVEGGGDALLLREYLGQWRDERTFRIAHLGWGTEHRARWETLALRGADGAGGAEARSIYGGVLLALGENRDLGGANAAPVHVDIALRHAALELDGVRVVEDGRFALPELA